MKKVSRTIRRRRREGKTDYKARLSLLKSGRPRAVFRKTNRHIIGQIVSSEVSQDKVVVSVTSKDLLAKGWPENLKGSLKSLQASYLTGFLLGKKSKDIKEAVFDIGLQRNIHKSKLYAFLKGLIDSGFDIPCGENCLPDEKYLNNNEKTKGLIDKIKGEIK